MSAQLFVAASEDIPWGDQHDDKRRTMQQRDLLDLTFSRFHRRDPYQLDQIQTHFESNLLSTMDLLNTTTGMWEKKWKSGYLLEQGIRIFHYKSGNLINARIGKQGWRSWVVKKIYYRHESSELPSGYVHILCLIRLMAHHCTRHCGRILPRL